MIWLELQSAKVRMDKDDRALPTTPDAAASLLIGLGRDATRKQKKNDKQDRGRIASSTKLEIKAFTSDFLCPFSFSASNSK